MWAKCGTWVRAHPIGGRLRAPVGQLPGIVAVDCPAVDFELSPEQTALREAAVSLLDRYASRDRLREFVGSGLDPVSNGGLDAPLWNAMAEQGWLGPNRPEEDGGLGLGMVEGGVLCEGLGRCLGTGPFLG